MYPSGLLLFFILRPRLFNARIEVRARIVNWAHHGVPLFVPSYYRRGGIASHGALQNLPLERKKPGREAPTSWRSVHVGRLLLPSLLLSFLRHADRQF